MRRPADFPCVAHGGRTSRWRTFVRLAPLACLWPAGSHAAALGDVSRGKAAFAVCASCHQVGPNARNGFGPPLNDIVGKAAGTSAGYPYSPAMKNAGVVWSAATLAAFIRSPDQVVPGTKMRFSSFGYGDERIADLVAYLGSLQTAAPSPGAGSASRPAIP